MRKVNAPNAGPMSVPLRNHPSAVARSVWHLVSFKRRHMMLGTLCIVVLDYLHRGNLPGPSKTCRERSNRLCEDCVATYRLVNISYNRTTDDQECSTLEGSQDSEDKERSKVWC
jgi:hypothetical protein